MALKSRTSLSSGLRAAVSFCLLMPLTAFSQQTPEQANKSARALEEIIVTAQKREQNINDVGIAITAFDAETIKDLRFQQPIDVTTQTANFSVNTLVTNVPNFTIRGVGVNDYAINQATSVGTYVDQVYISSPAMLNFQMFDVQRVEVLKGPQGTLYGRNTTGGAVQFISRTPTEELEAYADLEVGNYGYYKAAGAVSGSLSESVNARLAFDITNSDGYQTNLITGNEHGGLDRVSLRAMVDWIASDDFDMRLKVYAGQDNSSLNSLTVPGVGGSKSSNGSIDTVNGVPYRDNDASGISLIANWGFDNMTLTSVTSYDKLDRFEYGDSDGQYIDGRIDQVLISTIDQFTQELRLTSDSSGPLSWVGGLFYSTDEIDDGTIYEVTGAAFPPFVFGVPSSYAVLDELGNTFQQESKSTAIFGQVEYDINERWHLTGGLRYTWEDKELNNVTTPWGAFPGPGESGPDEYGLLFPPASYSEDFGAWSGKIGIDYQLNDDNLLYASISKGFKSGGFQGTLVFSPANIIPFDEEILWAYEVGSKSTLIEGMLQLNTAFFFYDYQNLQAQGTIDGGAGGVENLFALQNIGDAENIGFEVELQAAPADGLSLFLGVGYLDAEITDPFIAEVQPGGTPAVSPKWNFNGRGRYEFADSGSTYWFVQADFSYQDDVFFDIYETPFLNEDAYWLSNASFGVSASDGKWQAMAWGRNLADEEYRVGGFTGGVAGPVSAFGAPLTYGVTVSYNFD